MSTATAQRSNGAVPRTSEAIEDFSSLLEKAIASTPLTTRTKGIEATLMKGVEKMQKSMPKLLAGEAERLIRRAIIYIQMSPKLDDATPQSLMMCVIKAAEMGLPLDGKMCHAVVFNNKYKDANGKDYWAKEATPMPDYRGLITVARRTGLIEDIYADVICEGDEFSFVRTRQADDMRHSFDLLAERAKVIGVFCKVKPVGADWRFEIMTRPDIDSIRDKSKAKDNGPWAKPDSSDWRQMAKKTVLRRVLQMFYEDPGLAAAVDAEDSHYTLEDAGIVPEMPKRTKLSDIGATDDIAAEYDRRTASNDERREPERIEKQSSYAACEKILKAAGAECIDNEPGVNKAKYRLPNNEVLTIGDGATGNMSVDTLDPDAVAQVQNELDRALKSRAKA